MAVDKILIINILKMKNLPQNPTYDYIQYIGLGTASLIGAGVSAIGSLFSGQQSYKNNKKLLAQQNAYNVAMADKAYERDLDMWNRQNAYNSPSEQIERLKAAGLNPNLMYGNGADSGNAAAPPSYNAPMSDINRYQGDFGVQDAANAVSNGISQYIQTKLGMANIDNIQSNTALNNLRAIGQEINNAKDDITRSRLQEVYDAQLRALDNQAINAMANARLADNRAITEEQSRSLQLDILKQKLTQLEFANSLNPQQREHLAERIRNLRLQGDIREYEKDIQRVLVESGVNLRGGALERATNMLMEMLTDGESHSVADWLKASGVALIGAFAK